MNYNIPKVKSGEIGSFQKKILTHYALYKRDLPWRFTSDPYHILVSEFMLQQTQVSRVIQHYHDFLKKYPTVFHLSRAQKKSVLAVWSGLGYNNRALRLYETAKRIVKEFNGKIPADYQTLIKFPGIGDYIASAIAAFAYNTPLPVIDINIRRVFIHEFSLSQEIDASALKEFASQFIPARNSSEWHNALMDYGAAMKAEVKKSIPPLTKQSTFKGSDRELRGNIIRILIRHKKVTLQDLEKQFSKKNVSQILAKMVDEKLIKEQKGVFRI